MPSENVCEAHVQHQIPKSRVPIKRSFVRETGKIGEGGEANEDTQRRVARLELHGPLVVYVSAGHSMGPDWSIPAFIAVKAVHFRSFVRD